MGHIEFLKASGDFGIPFVRLSPEELAAEIAAASSL